MTRNAHVRSVASRARRRDPGHGGCGVCLRARAAARGAEDAKTLEQEMPLLLRALLAIDIAAFAGGGYWLGAIIVG